MPPGRGGPAPRFQKLCLFVVALAVLVVDCRRESRDYKAVTLWQPATFDYRQEQRWYADGSADASFGGLHIEQLDELTGDLATHFNRQGWRQIASGPWQPSSPMGGVVDLGETGRIIDRESRWWIGEWAGPGAALTRYRMDASRVIGETTWAVSGYATVVSGQTLPTPRKCQPEIIVSGVDVCPPDPSF